jgi:hypothetical protein
MNEMVNLTSTCIVSSQKKTIPGWFFSILKKQCIYMYIGRRRKIWTIWKNSKSNSEKIWKIWKISVLIIVTLLLSWLFFHIFYIISLFNLFYISFHNFLLYFPNLFTIQLGFFHIFHILSQNRDEMWNDMENMWKK